MPTLTDFVLDACDLDAVIYTDQWAATTTSATSATRT
jgi:hypothetical protein